MSIHRRISEKLDYVGFEPIWDQHILKFALSTVISNASACPYFAPASCTPTLLDVTPLK